MIALSSLHNFYKNQLDTSGSCEKIDFTKIYECLKPQFMHLSPFEVIDALNILHVLNVPNSNLFVITLLDLVKDYSKKLSFQEINKLLNLILKFQPTNLTKEVNNYLEEKFSEQILKLDMKNVDELLPAVHFAFKNIKDGKSVNVLIDMIENFQGRLKFEEALIIFNVLSSLKNIPHKLAKTMQSLKKTIVDNIDKLEYHHVLQIIEDISLQINPNYEELYDETFIDELVQKIIYENWNFSKGNNILHFLNSIQHVQMDLLDYLSAKLYEDQTNLTLDVNLLYPLVAGITLADYKPVFWDAIKESILNIEVSKVEHLKLCYYVFYLACLECFEPRLLNEVFSTKFIVSEEHQEILLKLYQIVKILCPLYKGPWPSVDLLESFKNIKQKKKFPLLGALKQALGEDVYIQTNVKTSLEHYIDHVVIMNKSGFPVAINSYGANEYSHEISYIEDLMIPPGTQTFLLLYAQPEWYARNTQRILGPYSLLIKTLETMSYTVIAVDGKKWQKMSLNKKISYIMQAIQLRFEADSTSTTS